MDTPLPHNGPPIHTERLMIRPLEYSDVCALFGWYSDPEVVRHIPRGVRDLAGSYQRLTDLISHHETHGVSKWAVTLRGTGVVIGDCGLQFLAGLPVLELGFHFARPHWGKGFATESAAACLTWALTHRAEPIVAFVDPEHRSPQRVLTKIGMRLAGREDLLGSSWLLYDAWRAGEARHRSAKSPTP